MVKWKTKLIIYLYFLYLIYSYISNLQAHLFLLNFLYSLPTTCPNYLSFSLYVKVIKETRSS